MIRANDNFKELPAVYLFTKISRRLGDYRKMEKVLPLIRMDIGDFPGPIPSVAKESMFKAVEELGHRDSFHGYGPEQGYLFLRETISNNDYKNRGIDISPEEIFVSDGAKCDIANLGTLFPTSAKVAIMDPSYPAYIDDNVIQGRAGSFINGRYSDLLYLNCDPENNYAPELPSRRADIIYICSPNNPTGTPLNKEELRKWVEYAKENESLIIFDSAYEAYVRNPEIPKSIFEVEGAKDVAIEIRSFSKTGGFTGIRCGYTVVPSNLMAFYSDGTKISLNSLWNRRQTTMFNGASYISQRGAEALYSEKGKTEVKEITDSYLQNAYLLKTFFEKSGWKVTGGVDSPYVWVQYTEDNTSEQLFEKILTECGVSTTPGSGFGLNGARCLRLSGFNSLENTRKAIERFEKCSLF